MPIGFYYVQKSNSKVVNEKKYQNNFQIGLNTAQT